MCVIVSVRARARAVGTREGGGRVRVRFAALLQEDFANAREPGEATHAARARVGACWVPGPHSRGGGEVLCLGLCVPDCAAAPSPVFCRDLRPRLLPPGLSGAQTRPSVSTSQRQTKMFNTSVSASPVAASPSPFLFSAFTSPRLESQRGAGAPT